MTLPAPGQSGWRGGEEATELWLHFQKVINWVEMLFPKCRKEMKGGKTAPDNLQMLCRRDNALKGDK